MTQAIFQDQIGLSTTEKTTVWCGQCKALFSADVVHSLDSERDRLRLEKFLSQGFSGLNVMVCPHCGNLYTAEEAFAVHLEQRLLLVIPERDNHRILKIKNEFWSSLLPEPGQSLPSFAAQFETISPAELGQILNPQPQMTAQVEQAFEEMPFDQAPTTEPFFVEQTADSPDAAPIAQAETEQVEDAQSEDAQSGDAQSGDAQANLAQPEVQSEPSWSESGAFWGDGAVTSESDDPTAEAPVVDEGWAEAILTEEELETEAASDEASSQSERLAELMMAQMQAAPALDPKMKLKLSVAGKSVVLQVTPRDQSLSGAELSFQLHRTPFGLVPMISCTWGEQEYAFVCFDPQSEIGERALNLLEQKFEIRFKIFSESGECLRAIECNAPLEANVARAKSLLQTSAEEECYDYARAQAYVEAPDFDRIGKLNHNFHLHSFEQVETASEARLALGIFSYWFAEERRDYLLSVKSFPVVWYEMLTDRVLYHAIDFGLAMDAELRRCAIERHFADDALELLKKRMQAFAEVSLALRPSDLDAIETWENWQALLAEAEELDFQIDPTIEYLIVRCMERAKDVANADSMELVAAALPERSVSEWTSWLSEHGDEESFERLQAMFVLAKEGDASCIPVFSHALRSLKRDELLRVIPNTLHFGAAIESEYLQAMHSKQAYLVWASALCLAEIRSEAAVEPLLQLMKVASADEWRILARAIARMGRRILTPSLAFVELNGDPEARVAYALALMAGDSRSALAAAREQFAVAEMESTEALPPQAACLDAALALVGQVEFGDAAEFSERLEEAFHAADKQEKSAILDAFADSSRAVLD